MAIKSFWIIILRVMGIWLLIDSLGVISQFFSSVFLLFSGSDYRDPGVIIAFIALLIVIFIYFLCFRLFIFKPDWLIRKLNLEQDFDEEKLDFNIPRETVIRIACIVTGAILLTDSLPQLVYRLFGFFQQQSLFKDSPHTGWILLELGKCVIAYFLIANNQVFSRFVISKSKEGGPIDEDPI